jgi:hypothetical protein
MSNFYDNLNLSGNLSINNSSTGNTLYINQLGSGNAVLIEDSTSPDATPFIIDSSGNVNIGRIEYLETSGGNKAKLQVNNSTSTIPFSGLPFTTNFIVQGFNQNSVGLFTTDINHSQIYFGTPSDVFGSNIRWDYSNRLLNIATQNTGGTITLSSGENNETVRILPNGNVGINNGSPTERLDVSGNTKISEDLFVGDTVYIGNVTGTPTTNASLYITQPSILSNTESPIILTEVDDASSTFFISNNSNTDGIFTPRIVGSQQDNDLRPGLIVDGVVLDTLDTTTAPALIFRAIRQNTGSVSEIVNRNLFEWRNFSSTKMTMDVDGNLDIVDGGLRINTLGTGTSVNNLGIDSSGNVVTGTTGGGTFTGNTSGDCITDLYVTNLYGCSPITVNDSIQSVTSSATGTTSFAFGFQTKAHGNYSHAEGSQTVASSFYSHAEGDNTTASDYASHAEGRNTTASGKYSHAEGNSTIANGIRSHAEGRQTTASGNASHAQGYLTKASGNYSHAQGISTTASGNYSHAEGYGNIASGIASHAEGGILFSGKGLVLQPTSATTYSSHAEGRQTLASGQGSHAEGAFTVASGQDSHAEGNNTTASNSGSHSEGSQTIASGIYSHAEGRETIASGQYSHAEGNNTTASGNNSHAEGTFTTASGAYSHVGGNNSTVSGVGSFIHSTNSLLTGNYSVILGGQGITGTSDNTVYVPSLEINGEVRELGGSNLTGDGTLTISGGVSTIAVRINGTNNVTLPNGTSGQKITIYVQQNTGVNTTIGGTFLGYSTVKLAAVGESVQLLYTGSGWVIIGGNNFLTT